MYGLMYSFENYLLTHDELYIKKEETHSRGNGRDWAMGVVS